MEHPQPAVEEVQPQAAALAHDFNNAVGTLLLNAQLVLEQLGDNHPLSAEIEEMRLAGERAARIARQLLWLVKTGSVEPFRPMASAPVAGSSGIVLVIEDDEHVRTAVQRVLESRGFRVLAAADGAEAEAWSTAETTIHLMLTDLELPDAQGVELARRLSGRHPEARVLYMSGSEQHALADLFLQKPFTPQALLSKVRLVLGIEP